MHTQNKALDVCVSLVSLERKIFKNVISDVNASNTL